MALLFLIMAMSSFPSAFSNGIGIGKDSYKFDTLKIISSEGIKVHTGSFYIEGRKDHITVTNNGISEDYYISKNDSSAYKGKTCGIFDLSRSTAGFGYITMYMCDIATDITYSNGVTYSYRKNQTSQMESRKIPFCQDNSVASIYSYDSISVGDSFKAGKTVVSIGKKCVSIRIDGISGYLDLEIKAHGEKDTWKIFSTNEESGGIEVLKIANDSAEIDNLIGRIIHFKKSARKW